MDRTYDQIRLYDVPIQKEIDSDDGRWLIQTEIGGDRGASSRLPFCCMRKIRHSELIRPSSGTKLLLRRALAKNLGELFPSVSYVSRASRY